jgi:heme/copper-type cytochrome/quinol oxidase subunit 2
MILPNYFIASPKNPLLVELSALHNYTDPINISSESSRELFYTNSKIFSMSLVYDILNRFKANEINLPLNISIFSDKLFFYLLGNSPYNSNLNINDFYKNQYRPMKKGVSNMIKLHATGAIAMPIETRLHLLASSKDVIHSWAIPSAGVKIDCVPGYSSHRVIIFLVSGIFWGQCMEICGRFHH